MEMCGFCTFVGVNFLAESASESSEFASKISKKKFRGETRGPDPPLREVASPARTYPWHGRFGRAGGQAPPVGGQKL